MLRSEASREADALVGVGRGEWHVDDDHVGRFALDRRERPRLARGPRDHLDVGRGLEHASDALSLRNAPAPTTTRVTFTAEGTGLTLRASPETSPRRSVLIGPTVDTGFDFDRDT